MILIPEVLTLLILNALFAFFATLVFVQALKIYLQWDINSHSQTQYKLEKQSYLSATIIKFIFSIKVPLFLFFIFTLDKLSDLLSGAMCGAGVVDATIYGNYLFALKILNIYLFAYWIALNHEDLKDPKQPYTKAKFGFFLILYFLFISETVLEFSMFNAIDVEDVVNCCGSIYSSTSKSYFATILSWDPSILVGTFYTNYLFILTSYLLRFKYIFAFFNITFIIVSLTTLITFFGTYIYELPSHHCPFCLLQSDYYYIGYFLYSFLFLGTFYAIYVGFIWTNHTSMEKHYKISFFFTSLYTFSVSFYPLWYYLQNGVFL